MLSRIPSFLLVFSTLIISMSCSHDQDDNAVYIEGKILANIVYKQHVYVYSDKPVTRIEQNSLSFSNGLLMSDTITVINFEYDPDKQFISQLFYQYEYNLKGYLIQQVRTGLVNQNKEPSTAHFFYDDEDHVAKVLYDEKGDNDSILIQYNDDNTFIKTEFLEGFKSSNQYSTDPTGKIYKLLGITFLDSPATGSQEVLYSGNNAMTLTSFTDSNDPTSKFETLYNYLENRPVPEILKNRIEPFFSGHSPIPIFNQLENIVLSYKDNFLDNSVDSYGKIAHEYNFSADGYPLFEKQYGYDKRISMEVEYFYK